MQVKNYIDENLCDGQDLNEEDSSLKRELSFALSKRAPPGGLVRS